VCGFKKLNEREKRKKNFGCVIINVLGVCLIIEQLKNVWSCQEKNSIINGMETEMRDTHI